MKKEQKNVSTTASDVPNSNKIDFKSLKEVIGILEQPKISDEEINSMIATLANMRGAGTFVSKYLPKDMVIIGIGDKNINPILSVEPKVQINS